jgi:hypothetical protein
VAETGKTGYKWQIGRTILSLATELSYSRHSGDYMNNATKHR